MLFLEQPLIFPFLCHRSAATCQIDSKKVSNHKLKTYLYKCIKPRQDKTKTIVCLFFCFVCFQFFLVGLSGFLAPES